MDARAAVGRLLQEDDGSQVKRRGWTILADVALLLLCGASVWYFVTWALGLLK